jgi:chemotaxis regulatin CheY-phosphate phosphatase CheZ
MNLNLATAHGGFGPPGHAKLARKAPHRAGQAGNDLVAVLKRLARRLQAALRPTDLDQAYLAEAQNLADLERRMQYLLAPERNRFDRGA